MSESKENKFKAFSPHLLWIVASFLIIWAAFLAYYEYSDYEFYSNKVPHFQPSSTIQDYGTVMSGTVGVLITLAGIFFLAFTLYQTQKELSDTQAILKGQLVESTFFNLLKNHKELIIDKLENPTSGLPLSKKLENSIEQLNEYASSLDNLIFETFEQTQHNAIEIYKINYKVVGRSLVHIVNFIYSKLDDSNFYHQTFYYNLSDTERLLLGLIFDNKLENVPPTKFNYLDDIRKITNYSASHTERKFPMFSFDHLLQQIFIPRFAYEGDIKRYINVAWYVGIIVDDNLIIFKDCRISIFKERTRGQFEVVIKNKELPVSKIKTGKNFLSLFIDDVFEHLDVDEKIYVEFTFVCDYKGDEYVLVDQLRFEAVWMTENDLQNNIDAREEAEHFNTKKLFKVSGKTVPLLDIDLRPNI